MKAREYPEPWLFLTSSKIDLAPRTVIGQDCFSMRRDKGRGMILLLLSARRDPCNNVGVSFAQ